MGHISISRHEFYKRAQKGNLIPVFRQILGDTRTPISIFKNLGGDKATNSFLLESVINGEQLGRYSFIGVHPRAVLRGKDGRFTYMPLVSEKGNLPVEFSGDPLAFIDQQLHSVKPLPDERLPAFYGGAVGFISYDTIRYYENIPDSNPDDGMREDTYLVFADEIIIIDHIQHHVKIVCNIHTQQYNSLDDAYNYAMQRLAFLEKRITEPGPEDEIKTVKGKMPITSNMTEQQYKDIVQKAKQYIHDGDIFQVVLSKRFRFNADVPAFQVYRALRSINPSPYMYYLNLGPWKIVGSSPEILVRLKNKKVTLRPIAGTRHRGKSHQEDLELEEELLNDQKEISEHIMLVDLGRNDTGRVCKPGSVKVSDFKSIERYSHVMHIVSNCEGILKDDIDPYDALRFSMPAGTVSGAPKIRAMEIIDELENVRRGIYAGSIGFFGYSGDFDLAIAIRTMIFENENCQLQAGAGIVYDSNPESECQEVANKVRGMLAAVRFARRGLV